MRRSRCSRPSPSGGEGFTVVSEEVGERSFGGGGRWRVVIDPIDGSLNAKRGLPLYALSVAVADGPAMADVALGYVLTSERRGMDRAARGRGHRRRRPARVVAPARPAAAGRARGDPPGASRAGLRALPGEVERVRVLGSLALALCHLADGRVDAVASLRPNGARSIDIAAAQLAVREAGSAIALPDAPGRSGRRRSISSGARGSSQPATTSAWRAWRRCSASAPRSAMRRIRASMRP